MKRVLAALLLLLPLSPARAAAGWERFFELSFGDLLATHAGAIFDPAEFILLGEYVASGAYRNASFAAYKQSKRKRGS